MFVYLYLFYKIINFLISDKLPIGISDGYGDDGNHNYPLEMSFDDHEWKQGDSDEKLSRLLIIMIRKMLMPKLDDYKRRSSSRAPMYLLKRMFDNEFEKN